MNKNSNSHPNANGEPEDTIDEPVMDGATEPDDQDADPRKGMSDPALIRHPDKGDKNAAPYNL